MKRYKGRYVGTIGQTPFTKLEEHRLRQAIGRLLPLDRGKQVWETSPGVYQVETTDQRDKRLSDENRDR